MISLYLMSVVHSSIATSFQWANVREVRLFESSNAVTRQSEVLLSLSQPRKELSNGRFVAVKRMPIGWTGFNQQDSKTEKGDILSLEMFGHVRCQGVELETCKTSGSIPFHISRL